MRVCGLAKHAECEVVYEYSGGDDEDHEDLLRREFHVDIR